MQRRAIWSGTENWSRNQLPKICRAAVDVAACEIRIRFLEIRRGHFVTRKNTIAKSRSEALDLRLDRARHVDLAAKRDVAISPKRMLAARRTRFIKRTLLRDEHEGSLGNLAVCHVTLGSSNFIDRSAEMDRARTPALLGLPRNGRR